MVSKYDPTRITTDQMIEDIKQMTKRKTGKYLRDLSASKEELQALSQDYISGSQFVYGEVKPSTIEEDIKAISDTARETYESSLSTLLSAAIKVLEEVKETAMDMKEMPMVAFVDATQVKRHTMDAMSNAMALAKMQSAMDVAARDMKNAAKGIKYTGEQLVFRVSRIGPMAITKDERLKKAMDLIEIYEKLGQEFLNNFTDYEKHKEFEQIAQRISSTAESFPDESDHGSWRTLSNEHGEALAALCEAIITAVDSVSKYDGLSMQYNERSRRRALNRFRRTAYDAANAVKIQGERIRANHFTPTTVYVARKIREVDIPEIRSGYDNTRFLKQVKDLAKACKLAI